MKRTAAILLIVICTLCSVSCGNKQEVLHMGLNAEVVGIDHGNSTLYVKDADINAGVFGERCALDCKEAVQGHRVIYVDYEDGGVREIEFDGLAVGDEVIVNMYESQRQSAKGGAAAAEQIQLATQRMD